MPTVVDRLGSAATAVDGSSLWAVRAIATKNDKQEKIHKKRINLTLPFQKAMLGVSTWIVCISRNTSLDTHVLSFLVK